MKPLLFLAAAAALYAGPQSYPPIHIAGNLYYVGDDDLASFLITTPQGDILINTGFEYAVPEIRDRMKQLGFKLTDIKILLVTHAHSDHAGGNADMKKESGAKMWSIEQETELLETGGKTDYLFGSTGWFKPVKVDNVFHDGDKIELGGTALTAHLTPGHTKGSVSYSFEVQDNNRTYHVLIANLPSINSGTLLVKNPKYPKIAGDYQHTFNVLGAMQCDIFLSSHAGQFGLLSKWRPGSEYNPDRFLDPFGLPRILERLETQFDTDLEEQREEEKAIEDRKHFKDVIHK
jgi:metallo-beta-lactamase class B